MNSKETYDIALRIGDMAIKNLQFFVIICTAFGGWIFAEDTISESAKFSVTRLLTAFVFTIPTAGLIYSEITFLGRLNATLEVSKKFFDGEVKGPIAGTERMFSPANTTIALAGMVGTVLFVDMLIIFM